MSGTPLNIVVIGRNGQLACELRRSLPALGAVTALGRPEVDLVDPDSIRRAIRKYEPDVIVNAAAYTAVDKAEADPDLVFRVNADAPAVMAEEAKRANALFVTYSTDYVFDGLNESPYTELDAPNPLNAYGASKLAGDRAVEAFGGGYLTFRTSWVYSARGKNFLCTILRLATEREQLRVVEDQIGAPTSSKSIADATARILGQLALGISPATPRLSDVLGKSRGLYNLTSSGSTSWYGFATAIIDHLRRRRIHEGGLAKIVPIASEEHPAAARRPKNSRLSTDKLYRRFGIEMPFWSESLERVMAEVQEQQIPSLQDKP